MIDPGLLRQAGERLAAWKSVLLLTHRRPDGDALGSLAAMKRTAQALGLRAEAFIYEALPPRYTWMQQVGQYAQWPGPSGPPGAWDGILILDTCSWSQLEPAAEFLRTSELPRIIVDHHATRDDLSAGVAVPSAFSPPSSESGQAAATATNRSLTESRPGSGRDLYCIDPTSASACGLVCEWHQACGWPIEPVSAEGLFAGIAADTGWFRFPNTDGRTLRAAADLLEQGGVRPDVLYARLNGVFSPARLRLEALMLAGLEYHADGRLAEMTLTREMFAKAGAAAADAEELVNEAMMVGPVVVSLLLTEDDQGQVRVNLRSKSPEVAGINVDVAAIARQFGGGGHTRAAGARVAGSVSEVRAQVRRAVLQFLST